MHNSGARILPLKKSVVIASSPELQQEVKWGGGGFLQIGTLQISSHCINIYGSCAGSKREYGPLGEPMEFENVVIWFQRWVLPCLKNIL